MSPVLHGPLFLTRCHTGATSDAVGWPSSITRLVALNQCSHLDAFLCLSLA